MFLFVTIDQARTRRSLLVSRFGRAGVSSVLGPDPPDFPSPPPTPRWHWVRFSDRPRLGRARQKHNWRFPSEPATELGKSSLPRTCHSYVALVFLLMRPVELHVFLNLLGLSFASCFDGTYDIPLSFVGLQQGFHFVQVVQEVSFESCTHGCRTVRRHVSIESVHHGVHFGCTST